DARPYAATGRIPSRSYVARVDLCNPREGPPHGVPPLVRASCVRRSWRVPDCGGAPRGDGGPLDGPADTPRPGGPRSKGTRGGQQNGRPSFKAQSFMRRAAAASATEDGWPAMGAEGGYSSSAPSTACVERQYGWAR
ncbi:unnamed protein product, partial [Ixodes pacificus]